MNTKFQSILSKKLAKGNKINGFTLIELMVVVAIVGILSGVGLPQLLKAQDKAKDSVAIATLTNAAKECSLILVTENGDGTSFDDTAKANYTAGANTLGGDCEVYSGTGDKPTLTLQSESASGTTYEIAFDEGGIPEPYAEAAAAAPGGTV